MTRDWMFGIIMAGAVALYPNLIDGALYLGGADDLGSKTWLIFLAMAGPAFLAPVLFGVRRRPAEEPGVQRVSAIGKLVAGLAISGVFSSAYFFAVIGFGNQAGLGAGLAEILDSSFFPLAYIAWLWLIGFLDRRAGSIQAPSRRTWVAAIVVGAGLLVLGAATRFHRNGESIANDVATSAADFTLVICAVVGAVAAAVALWLLRRLVRTRSVSLGIAVSCRYGGAALGCLLLAVWQSGYHGLEHLGRASGAVTFLIGALLINGIYLAAVHVESDVVQAASMGLAPLFAVLLESFGNRLSCLESRVHLGGPGFWIGTSVTLLGIFLIWRDPVIRRA